MTTTLSLTELDGLVDSQYAPGNESHKMFLIYILFVNIQFSCIVLVWYAQIYKIHGFKKNIFPTYF